MDVEIVLQLLFTVFKLLLNEGTRAAVIAHERLAGCVLDLVGDPHPDIRRFANLSLDIIMVLQCQLAAHSVRVQDNDASWRNRVRDKRFIACNREWLAYIEQHGGVSTVSFRALPSFMCWCLQQNPPPVSRIDLSGASQLCFVCVYSSLCAAAARGGGRSPYGRGPSPSDG